MTIGSSIASLLPENHVDALHAAATSLVDEYLEDIGRLSGGVAFADTSMVLRLPRKHLGRYDAAFAKRYLTCLTTVIWKLWSPDAQSLACTAEELALNAIIRRASAEMKLRGERADFNLLYEYAYEDMDFVHLFDDALDGFEESEEGIQMGVAGMGYEDWFEPFADGYVHPYVAREDFEAISNPKDLGDNEP